MKWTMPLALAVVLAAALVLASTPGQGAWLAPDYTPPEPDQPPTDEHQQTTTIFEDALVMITPSTYTPAEVAPDQAAANERAFRDMLAYAEGTSGPDGYRTLFGGALFDSFDDHPRVYTPFRNKAGQLLRTSAAGRYQFLARTWDSLAARLGLPDFGPDSQDAACMELIRERGALNDVRAGRLAEAVRKCAPIWASLPGAGYSQPERKLSALQVAYASSGGILET
ncbi:MAG: glycoside hydrolase family 104 protein [Pseudomonadota bacterium]